MLTLRAVERGEPLGPVVGVIGLILIVVVLYAIRFMNNLSHRNSGGPMQRAWGRDRAARAGQQSKIRQGLAAREALATYVSDAPRATRPLGIEFSPNDSAADGVLIESVTPGTAAARIGVPAGAHMISIGGRNVADRAAADAAVAEARGGIPLNLVWRVEGKDHRDSVIL